jgi:hypothetical protein
LGQSWVTFWGVGIWFWLAFGWFNVGSLFFGSLLVGPALVTFIWLAFGWPNVGPTTYLWLGQCWQKMLGQLIFVHRPRMYLQEYMYYNMLLLQSLFSAKMFFLRTK